MEFARCPPSFFHLSFSLHHFWREADYDGEEGNEGGYGRRRREEKEEGGRERENGQFSLVGREKKVGVA